MNERNERLVIANWKSLPERLEEVDQLIMEYQDLAKEKRSVTLVACPPSAVLSRPSLHGVILGAQGCAAYHPQTGSVSAKMYRDMGVRFCILGHSETRKIGITNKTIQLQIANCIENAITPIVCIGEETKDDELEAITEIERQITELVTGLDVEVVRQLIIAYEPVWAVGEKAARECTPDECAEAIMVIKKTLVEQLGDMSLIEIPFLYGGSVSPENTASYFEGGMIQGVLIGRASLDVQKVRNIINAIETAILSVL